MGILNVYNAVPVPPEANLEIVRSPQARTQFEAGEGGVLGVQTTTVAGVWAPPISTFRETGFLPPELPVRFSRSCACFSPALLQSFWCSVDTP